MQCVTETFLYVSPLEISKSEKGGRRGVLLPGQERRWARTVFAAEDGSLWVSKRLSQSVRGHPLRIKRAIFTVHTDTKAESMSVQMLDTFMTAGWIPVMVKMSRQCGTNIYGIVRYMQRDNRQAFLPLLKPPLWCCRWRRHPWDLPQVLRRSLAFPLFRWDPLSFPEARMLSQKRPQWKQVSTAWLGAVGGESSRLPQQCPLLWRILKYLFSLPNSYNWPTQTNGVDYADADEVSIYC